VCNTIMYMEADPSVSYTENDYINDNSIIGRNLKIKTIFFFLYIFYAFEMFQPCVYATVMNTNKSRLRRVD